MRMLIYLALALIGLVLLVFGVLGVVGSFVPLTHTASVSVEVGMPRDQVWALLDDPAGFPAWLPGLEKVEMLPDRDGRRVFRQTQGRNTFVLEETEKRAPELVTRTIADDHKMFTGSWEHRLEAVGAGRTKVTVTETGTVPSPIPRAIMRFGIGYDHYLNKFAEALKAKCGA